MMDDGRAAAGPDRCLDAIGRTQHHGTVSGIGERLAVALSKQGIAFLIADDGEHMKPERRQIRVRRGIERVDRVRFDMRRMRVDQALRFQSANEIARGTVAMQRLVQRRGERRHGRSGRKNDSEGKDETIHDGDYARETAEPVTIWVFARCTQRAEYGTPNAL